MEGGIGNALGLIHILGAAVERWDVPDWVIALAVGTGR